MRNPNDRRRGPAGRSHPRGPAPARRPDARALTLVLAAGCLLGAAATGFARSSTAGQAGSESTAASEACDSAQTLVLQQAPAVGPAVVALREADSEEWKFPASVQVERGIEPADPRLVLCVAESLREESRKYTDGASALTRTWDVRVVRLDDGALVRRQQIASGAPSTKSGPGAGVGPRPVDSLPSLVDHESIRAVIDTDASDVAFSPSGEQLATAGENGMRLKVWDLETRTAALDVKAGRSDYGSLEAVAFSPDGTLVVSSGQSPADSGTQAKRATIWRVAARDAVRQLSGHSGELQSLAFSSDGSRIASVGNEGGLILWDVATGEMVHHFRLADGGRSRGQAGAVSPDGGLVAVADSGGRVAVWNAAEGSVYSDFTIGRSAYALSFSPGGDLLAIGGATAGYPKKGLLVLWSVEQRSKLREIEFESEVVAIAFSPDGSRFAVGSGGKVELWDTRRAKRLAAVAHHGWLRVVAFSPDGATLASGAASLMDNRGLVKLWDVAAMLGETPPSR